MKNREYYETPESTKVMRLLWAAAGGDRYILERATYSDQIKYMCLGGIVFATGAMAALAGGYAFYTIFSPKDVNAVNPDNIDIFTSIISIIFGVIWGLIIFNIDRFIVTSTGKGDGTEKITWEEFKSAIPRIIMGIIIAITISKPIEIRMFQSEINSALQQYQDSIQNINNIKADNNFENKIQPYKKQLEPLLTLIEVKQQRRSFLDSMISYETFNGGCKGKCEENKRERILINQEIESIKSSSDYVKYDSLIKYETDQLDKYKRIIVAQKKGLNGLLIRIQLSHEIAGFWISLFITLLFMTIELTPIFFKLMLTKTPYDYLSENRDDLIRAENGIEVRYDYYKDKVGQERHLIINHEAERMIYEKMKVTEIQKNLTDYAASKYEEQEKKKIDENPNDFIA